MSKRKRPATEVKPASTADLRREGRLARIAKALASGATVTDIAEAEGIGRTLASREANSPDCRQLIAESVGDEWEEIARPASPARAGQVCVYILGEPVNQQEIATLLINLGVQE
jgi:hypothetical protein